MLINLTVLGLMNILFIFVFYSEAALLAMQSAVITMAIPSDSTDKPMDWNGQDSYESGSVLLYRKVSMHHTIQYTVYTTFTICIQTM